LILGRFTNTIDQCFQFRLFSSNFSVGRGFGFLRLCFFQFRLGERNLLLNGFVRFTLFFAHAWQALGLGRHSFGQRGRINAFGR